MGRDVHLRFLAIGIPNWPHPMGALRAVRPWQGAMRGNGRAAAVRRKLRVTLREIGHRLVSLGRRALATERERRVLQWLEGDYDKTLRLAYDLDEHSLVLDVGGYEGQWASDIFARFRCRVHVFEPSAAFVAGIRERFERNPSIVVHGFGLASQSTDQAVLILKGQGSSLFHNMSSALEKYDRTETVSLVCAADFFSEWTIGEVDLIKINIEGGEYDLLQHLIESGLVNQIANIQVQFHDFVPNAQERMELIHRQLRESHFVTFYSEFVWENWARKP